MSKRKYVHIKAIEEQIISMCEAKDLIDRYIHFCNCKRIRNKTGVAPQTLRHSA